MIVNLPTPNARRVEASFNNQFNFVKVNISNLCKQFELKVCLTKLVKNLFYSVSHRACQITCVIVCLDGHKIYQFLDLKEFEGGGGEGLKGGGV